MIKRYIGRKNIGTSARKYKEWKIQAVACKESRNSKDNGGVRKLGIPTVIERVSVAISQKSKGRLFGREVQKIGEQEVTMKNKKYEKGVKTKL